MGLFDDATEVIFDGEEVISIVSGDDIIWEKETTTQDIYSLTLSSDKDVLVCESNDTATLTALLTKNDVPLENGRILFDDGTSTILYENIVTGNTPDYTTRSLGDMWKMDIVKNNSSQIDIYATSVDYIRIKFSNNQFKLSSSPFSETVYLNGNVLYHCYGVFYTDAGDSVDWSYNINSLSNYSFTTLKFAVYAQITKIESFGTIEYTDSNGEAEYTYTGSDRGVVTVSAKYKTLASDTYNITDCPN